MTSGSTPLLDLGASGAKRRIPVALSFTLALALRRPRIDAEIVEYHRLEPIVSGFGSSSLRTLVMHQNMDDLRNEDADIRWRYAPWGYDWFERFTISGLDAVMCVREDGVDRLARRFPSIRERMRFVPTWADPSIFGDLSGEHVGDRGSDFGHEWGWSKASRVIVSVGRLDAQKDPLRLLKAFGRVALEYGDLRLLYVGDGPMRHDLEESARDIGLEDRVAITGVVPSETVSAILRRASVFALASAYEGMPVSVMEALAVGVPVVATPVGEIPRVVRTGENGIIASDRAVETIASALSDVVKNLDAYDPVRIRRSAIAFDPRTILAGVYRFYSDIAEQRRQASAVA